MNARAMVASFARTPRASIVAGNEQPRGMPLRAAMKGVLLAVGIALVAYLACIPVARPVTLTVGQIGDRLTLSGVNGDERDLGIAYRWTTTRTLFTIPGYGGVRAARVTVTARYGRADANGHPLVSAVPFTADAGGAVAALSADTAWTDTAADLTRVPGGDALPVSLHTPRYPAPADLRVLGVQVTRVRVEPLATDWMAGALGGWTWGLRFALLAAVVAFVVPGRAERWRGAIGGAAAVMVALLALVVPESRLIALPLLLPGTLVIAGSGILIRGRRAFAWLLARRPLLRAWAGSDGSGTETMAPSLERRGSVTHSVTETRRFPLARVIVGAVIAAYVGGTLAVVTRMEFIGHADYADNAVRARNLVAGRGDVVDYVAQFYHTYPATITHPAETWPPLQVWMIAVAFRLFGVSTIVAKLPNLAVMAGLLALVAGIGAWRWGRWVSVIAALLLAANLPLFAGALVPENDLVFTLLFACFVIALDTAWLAGGENEGDAQAISWVRSVPLRGVIFVGISAGLLILAKPSGAVLVLGAVGMAWLIARRRGQRVPGRWVVAAAGVAALTYAPWAVRNVRTFGTPFFSTESLDAWVLKYDPKQPVEGIYRVFVGKPLPHPRELIGYGYDHFFAVQGREITRFWGGLTGGALVPGVVLALAVVGIVVGASRRAGIGPLLVGAFVPYTAFVLLYWHYEARYFLVFVPWLLLYAAAGIVWIAELLAARVGRVGRVVGPLVALALTLAVMVPGSAGMIAEARAQTDASDPVAISRWIAANTPPDAVVMTRNPWEISWHSGRRAVMIPVGTTDEIYATMRRYHVTVLELDHLNDQNTIREGLPAQLYSWRDAPGITRATYNPDAHGTATYLIYRVDPEALPGG